MAEINEAKSKMEDFFTKELKKDAGAVRIMEVSKTEGGWIGRVEVTEDNLFIKKLGYPPVYDKNIYKVKMDDNLNLVSYKQQGKEEEEETE